MAIRDAADKINAGSRDKFGRPLQFFKSQFGFTKVEHRSLARNTPRLRILLTLSNLWMVRKYLSRSTKINPFNFLARLYFYARSA